VQRLQRELDAIRIGLSKLHVNTPRFEKGDMMYQAKQLEYKAPKT